MAERVNHATARTALIDAISASRQNTVETAISIEDMNEIFHGTHKTFRYMFLTAILSKHVNSNVNALSLQADWNDPGAYDARSVCHKAIVPIEEEYLGFRLGASNEPFLNKPARFQCISSENPVRRGNDARLLSHLVDCLTRLNELNEQEIQHSLYNAISSIMELESMIPSAVIVENHSISSEEVSDILEKILDVPCEGQSCVVVFGAIMKLIHGIDSVLCHPVNQAGSSSNEIGDVDFLENGIISHCAELKDKQYRTHDVNHACRKAVSGGCNRIIFVHGINGEYIQDQEEQTTFDGLDIVFLNLDGDWILKMIQTFSDSRLRYLISLVYSTVDEIRGSDMLRQHVEQVMNMAGILTRRI